MPITLTGIHIYPVKSIAAVDLTEAYVKNDGLAFDRRLVLVDDANRFVTARLFPKLVKVHASLLTDGLVLVAPGMEKLSLRYSELEPIPATFTLWRDTVLAHRCHVVADAWFSRYLDRPVRLLHQNEATPRQRDVNGKRFDVNFADSCPILLTTQASLAEVAQQAREPISMRRFRPNLVVSGDIAPFAEDGWQQVRIGDVVLDLVKPCSRCVFTTIDPETGEKNVRNEPFETLKRFRGRDGSAYFGLNMMPLAAGTVRLGDSVEILSTGEAPRYGAA